MEKQGLYPPWMEEIAPLVLELLTKKGKIEINANDNVFDISNAVDENIQEKHESDVINNGALLDFLVEKLSTQCEPCNDEVDVKDEINQLNMNDEIPMNLLHQPKNDYPLSMARQGLYPPWIEEISPLVLGLLTKKK